MVQVRDADQRIFKSKMVHSKLHFLNYDLFALCVVALKVRGILEIFFIILIEPTQ